MVASAAVLLGTRGVEATSFSAVLAESQAPRGSVYHYFPGGKRQLLEDAVRWTGDQVLAHQRTCRASTPGGVVAHFGSFFRPSVVATGCRAGCPVAAVVASDVEGEALARAVRTGFTSWTHLLADQLQARGLPPSRARGLAVTTVAAVEGALILCRAEARVEPLDAVVAELGRRADRSRGRERAEKAPVKISGRAGSRPR
jgi:TetR/AcrR family transcriptional repressor of lmrAB and yxaGH operons